MAQEVNISNESNLIFSLADDLRGDFKAHDNQDIILPFMVLRRLEINLEKVRKEIKDSLPENHPSLKFDDVKFNEAIHDLVMQKIKYDNKSEYSFKSLVLDDEKNIKKNFITYLDGFTENIKHIILNFDFYQNVEKLAKNDLLLRFIQRFASNTFDFLSPDKTSNEIMGYIFEDLIRRFSEQSNETAGEHFTPREVIQLMVKLLGIDTFDIPEGKDINVYDPACGTGGMLTIAEKHIRKLGIKNNVNLYGQELNPKSYAVCYSDMLLKGENPTNIKEGNTLTDDQLEDMKFDFMLSNPPFGVSWKKYANKIIDLKTKNIKLEKFKMGTPRTTDGSLLFLQHMISKMRDPQDGGSGIGIVFNGSPLFVGDAGSGESEIRKYFIENDLIDTIVSLPANLFYNTPIATYIWILRNDKRGTKREGKIQLINGIEFYSKMLKSLGDKRQYISTEKIEKIADLHKQFKDNKYSKVFNKEEFLFKKVFLSLEVKEGNKKKKKSDYEKVPFTENTQTYLDREVELPYKIKKEVIGCEINFSRYFYEYEKLRNSLIVQNEIIDIEKESKEILNSLNFK